MHEAKILYGTYCVSGVRATILYYGHAVYIATDRPLARILLLLLLYKEVLFTFSGSCYNTSEGLIFLETGLIVKLNFYLHKW